MTKRKPFEDRPEANEGKSPVPTWGKDIPGRGPKAVTLLGCWENRHVSEAEQSVGEGRCVGSEVGEVPGGVR